MAVVRASYKVTRRLLSLTGTDKQAGAQDHLLCQADALTKNVDLPLFVKSNFDVTTFLI